MIPSTLHEILEQSGAQAALFFVDGALVFAGQTDEGHVVKCVSPEGARLAFDTHIGIDTGWLPEGVRRVGFNEAGEWFVYEVPPHKRILQVTADDGEVKTIFVPLPRLVFVAGQHEHWLWALKAPLSESSELWRCPLPNVYYHGRVCWGSVPTPEIRAMNANVTFQRFMSGVFTRSGAEGKSQTYPHDVRRLLFDLHDSGANEFPLSELVLANQKIDDIL